MAAGTDGQVQSSVDGWAVAETHGQVTFRPDTVSHPVGLLDTCLSIHVPTCATIHVSVCPHLWGSWRIQDGLRCPAGHTDRAVGVGQSLEMTAQIDRWTDGHRDGLTGRHRQGHVQLDTRTVHTWTHGQFTPGRTPRQCPPAPPSPCTTPKNAPFYLKASRVAPFPSAQQSTCPSVQAPSVSGVCPSVLPLSPLPGGTEGPLTPPVGLGGCCGVFLARLPTPSSFLGHQQPLFVLVLSQNRLCSAPHPQPRVQGEGLPKFCPKPPFPPHLPDFNPFTPALIGLPTCTWQGFGWKSSENHQVWLLHFQA
ncbi:atrophin-1-like [Passer montanus]|uniref:atrophin-1-like n=1 Tax=Passer montanus TaxID=9160 RepID=UPI0019604B7A|nr:atrophin-1-like [Passer montanus]